MTNFCSTTWYLDTDGDGVGDVNEWMEACEQPQGYAAIAGDLCPADGNKTDPGTCGCGLPEGNCTDDVSFTQPITTVPSITQIQVDLDYQVSEQRDLVLVLLDGNGAWVGNYRATVPQGTGTQRMTITLANPPTVGPSYRLDAYVRTVGGDFTTNITSDSRNITVVASGMQDCAGVVDGIAMEDDCGVCSGGTTGIEPQYGTCATEENIAFIQEYSILHSSTAFLVEVSYEANVERDIVVLLNAPNGDWLGNGTVTVEAGAGTVQLMLNVANAPAPGPDYKLGAALRQVGTGWDGNVDHVSHLVEIVDPYACQENVVYAECFEASGFDDWGGWGAAERGITSLPEYVYEGNRSLHIQGVGAANLTIENLKANTTYELVGVAKVMSAQAVNFGVKSYDANDTDLPKVVTSTVFEEQRVEFTTGPSHTSAQIYWYSPQAEGEGALDNVTLVEKVITGTNALVNQKVVAFPNPTTHAVNLSGVSDEVSWELLNVYGQIVMQGSGSEVDLSHYPNGVFFLQVSGQTIRLKKM